MPHEPRKLLSCLRGVNVINRHVEQLAHRCRHVAARGTLGLRHRLWNAAANANQNSEPWEQARAWLTSAPGRQRRAASTSAAAQTLGANLRKHRARVAVAWHCRTQPNAPSIGSLRSFGGSGSLVGQSVRGCVRCSNTFSNVPVVRSAQNEAAKSTAGAQAHQPRRRAC